MTKKICLEKTFVAALLFGVVLTPYAANAQTPQQMEYERQQREYRLQLERQREQQQQQQLMNENARRQQEQSSWINAPAGQSSGGSAAQGD